MPQPDFAEAERAFQRGLVGAEGAAPPLARGAGIPSAVKKLAARMAAGPLAPFPTIVTGPLGGYTADELAERGELALKSLASGFATTGKSAAGLGGWVFAGRKDKVSQKFAGLAKLTNEFLNAKLTAWQAPPELLRDLRDAPELLADSRWWAASAPQVVGTMLPLLLPGAAAGTTAYYLSQAARLGIVGTKLATTIAASSGMAAGNALFDGSLAFLSAKEAGASQSGAAEIAKKVARRTFFWTALSTGAGMGNQFIQKGLRKMVVAAFLGGAEEAGEEYRTAQILHAEDLGPPPRLSGTAFALGGIGEAGGSLALDAAFNSAEATLQEAAQPDLAKYKEQILAPVVDDLVASGMSPDEAHTRSKSVLDNILIEAAQEGEPEVPGAPLSPEFTKLMPDLAPRRPAVGPEVVTPEAALPQPGAPGEPESEALTPAKTPEVAPGEAAPVEGGEVQVPPESVTTALPGPQEVVSRKFPPATGESSLRKKGLKTAVLQATGVKKEEIAITLPETRLLKMRLQAQALGAKAGAREASGQVRAEVTAEFRARLAQSEAAAKGKQKVAIASLKAKAEDIKAIKKAVAAYITTSLPLAERGRFIAALRDAKTQRQAGKVFGRVDIQVEKVKRADYIRDIRRRLTRIMASSKVDVDYKARVTQLLASIELQGHAKRTFEKLRSIQEFIDRKRQNGEDVEMPQRILDRLAILARQQAEELDTGALENLIISLELMERLGKLQRGREVELFKAEQRALQEDLVAVTRPLEKNPILEARPGEKLTIQKGLTNYYSRIKNAAIGGDIGLTPWAVIFDILDGNAGYRGPNVTYFLKRINAAKGYYAGLRDSWTNPVLDLARDLKIPEQRFAAITVHALRVQEGGKDYLRKDGITEKEITDIKLSTAEMKVYLKMREMIEQSYPLMAAIIAETKNKKVAHLNNYFPVQGDFKRLSELDVVDRVAPDVDVQQRRFNATQGFIEERTGGRVKLRRNSLEVFVRHMDDVAYLVAMQRHINLLKGIVLEKPQFDKAGRRINKRTYREAAGDYGTKMAADFVELVARKGGARAGERISILAALDRNFGAATLGLNLSSAMVQFTALFDGAAHIGGEYVFGGFADILRQKPLRQFLTKYSPALRARFGDDLAFHDLAQTRWLAKLQKAGYGPLQFTDHLTAAGVLLGAYRRELDKKGTVFSLDTVDKDAMNEAEFWMNRSQGSSDFIYAPPALTGKHLTESVTLNKALLRFQSFILNRWSSIRHDAWRAGIREENPAQAARILGWLAIATLAEVGIRDMAKELEVRILLALGIIAEPPAAQDDDDFDRKVLQEVIRLHPITGNAYSIYKYGSPLIPSFKVVTDAIKGAGKALTGKSAPTRRNGYRQAITGLFAGAGIPGTAQLSRLVRLVMAAEKGGGRVLREPGPEREERPERESR